MPNGDLWMAIDAMRTTIQKIEAYGCAHKRGQDEAINKLWIAWEEARKERKEMKEQLDVKLDRLYYGIIAIGGSTIAILIKLLLFPGISLVGK